MIRHKYTRPPGNTEEYEDGALTGNLGEVLIRCNNVLYIRAAPEESGMAE